jgi:hypothetical protein
MSKPVAKMAKHMANAPKPAKAVKAVKAVKAAKPKSSVKQYGFGLTEEEQIFNNFIAYNKKLFGDEINHYIDNEKEYDDDVITLRNLINKKLEGRKKILLNKNYNQPNSMGNIDYLKTYKKFEKGIETLLYDLKLKNLRFEVMFYNRLIPRNQAHIFEYNKKSNRPFPRLYPSP